jgi:hypothetical protein
MQRIRDCADMERVGEHPVPSGPLAVRWLAYEVDPPRAGAPGRARVLVENAGSATWRSRGGEGVQLSYHWLDPLGNPVHWDGLRAALPRPVAPGEELELVVPLLAPRPPGRYRLAFDFVEENRFWFAEVGQVPLEVETEVLQRIAERRLAVRLHGGADPETAAALAAQDEPVVDTDPAAVAHLVPGALPAPDWSRRVLDAHAEGWEAVGPGIEPQGLRKLRSLDPWKPRGGRNPRFGPPLLLPSLLAGLDPVAHQGYPSYAGDEGVFDGRIVIRLRPRSDRPGG